MTEKPIRVAVVGVGDFGRNHVRVWSEMEGVQLVGDGAHSPREHVVISKLPERAALIAGLLATL